MNLLQDNIAPRSAQADYLRTLEREIIQLESTSDTILQLRHPVSIPAILSLLSHIADEDIALTRLIVDPPSVQLSSQSSDHMPALSSRRTVMELEGVATSPESVVAFISNLSNIPEIRDISLEESADRVLDTHAIHAFRIRAIVTYTSDAHTSKVAVTNDAH